MALSVVGRSWGNMQVVMNDLKVRAFLKNHFTVSFVQVFLGGVTRLSVIYYTGFNLSIRGNICALKLINCRDKFVPARRPQTMRLQLTHNSIIDNVSDCDCSAMKKSLFKSLWKNY